MLRTKGSLWLLGALGLSLVALGLLLPLPTAGQVVDPQGRPVQDASVRLDVLGGGLQVDADHQGRYLLPMPHIPGTALARADATGYLPDTSAGGRQVLHRLPRLTGRIVDDAGAPVAGATVTVKSVGGHTERARAGRDGSYSFPDGLPPGKLEVTGSASYHLAARSVQQLGLDQRGQLTMTLQRQFATLDLASDPAGMALMVDGKAAADCAKTPCQAAIPAGRHTLAIQNDLYVPWQQVVDVRQGTLVNLAPKLQRKTGSVVLTAPGGSEVSLDDQVVGSGNWKADVPTGDHLLSVRADGTWPAVQKVGVQWKQTAQMQLAPTAVATDPAGFTGQLNAYTKAVGGQYAVYLEDLTTGQTIGSGQDNSMEAASVIKLPEALYLLHQADANQLKLTDPVTLQPQDFMGGTGVLYSSAKPGQQISYQDLLNDLIQQSDNTAWQALDRQLGATNVDAFAASMGAPACRQEDDQCSPHQIGTLLDKLARGQAVSPGSTQTLLNLLETTAFNDRINTYLPDVQIAHKIGIDGQVNNDAGIVYLNGHPFILVVFTRADDPDTGIQAIRDIARASATLIGG
ncbi:MAG: serine hydrolase [Candidatus Dormibacteraeota bacterium]|nr:serine hydrolase [Candidatus Dormibacteraeota bacterium]MBO0761677.1 serine hydrolase [Candidatus Dormibacteraeota bacterium]